MADNSSDIGAQELFRGPAAAQAQGYRQSSPAATAQASPGSRGARPVVFGEEATGGGWGRGPAETDKRKFKYDRVRGMSGRPVPFSVTKADRLDAQEAGDILHSIHVKLGIDREEESRIAAFDEALWWQHTINGASVMQEHRGSLSVDGMEFDIAECLSIIGKSRLRRFFRAYADEILEANRTVARGYDPYDPVATEKHGQLMQIAAARGLHKHPELAFDAADACLSISLDERRILQASKARVIPAYNATDRPFARPGMAIGSGVATEVETGED